MSAPRYCIRLLALATLTIAALDAARAQSIGFDDAWHEVQRINGGLAAGRANVDRSALVQDAARSLYLPEVGVAGSYTRLDQQVEVDLLDFNPLAALRSEALGQDIVNLLGGEAAFTTPLTERGFGRVALTALWPVYTGGRINAAQDVAAAQKSLAEQLLDQERRIAFEELCQIYFGVALAARNLKTRQAAEAGLLLHLNDAIDMQEQGVIARVSRLAVEAAHDRAKVAARRAQQDYEIAEIALRRLLHRERQIDPRDALFVNFDLPAVERFVVAALGNSPAIESLEAQEREVQALIKAEQGRYHPEFFVFADYTVYEDDSIASGLLPDWQIGLGMTLTLVDRVDRSSSVGAARKARQSIVRLSEEAARSVALSARVLHKQTEQALQEYDGLQSSLELARENLKLRREAFLQGLSTSVELVDAQLLVSVVETELSAAAYQYVTTLAKLLALTGETDEFMRYQQRSVRLRTSDEGES